MSRIASFVDIQLAQCLKEVSSSLDFHESTLQKVGNDPQADEADKKALSNALVRIQKVRNGLHGG